MIFFIFDYPVLGVMPANVIERVSPAIAMQINNLLGHCALRQMTGELLVGPAAVNDRRLHRRAGCGCRAMAA
jgi:hypothetical protein